MITVFTICSNNYLGQTKVLVDSFLKYHKDIKIFIGLVDRKSDLIDYSVFNCPIIQVEEINIQGFSELTLKYDITELNTAVKPFYFQYLFAKGYNKVIYIDPDIMFFSGLFEIIENLNQFSICLTPHILYPTDIAQMKWELNPLQYGLFNLGFIALSKTLETEEFIFWWGERTYNYCFYDKKFGIFVDQLWATLLPVFYDTVKIVKSPGYNLAYWNLHERTVSKKNGVFFVNNEFPLVFCHFSSFNFECPEKFTKHPIGEELHGRNDILEISKMYVSLMTNNNCDFYKSVEYEYQIKKRNVSTYLKLKNRIINRIIYYLNKF